MFQNPTSRCSRPPKSRLLEGEEALATLARRYFVSHGPATVYDFAWWTGLSITEARLGMKLVEENFVQATVAGRMYWSGETALPTPRPSPDAYPLPLYDEFTVAYKDRRAILDPTFTKEALYGIGPSIVIDGRHLETNAQKRRCYRHIQSPCATQQKPTRGTEKGRSTLREIPRPACCH
jgi:hypothetical protein